MRRAERREVAAVGLEGKMSRTGIWALDGIDGYLITCYSDVAMVDRCQDVPWCGVGFAWFKLVRLWSSTDNETRRIKCHT